MEKNGVFSPFKEETQDAFSEMIQTINYRARKKHFFEMSSTGFSTYNRNSEPAHHVRDLHNQYSARKLLLFPDVESG